VWVYFFEIAPFSPFPKVNLPHLSFPVVLGIGNTSFFFAPPPFFLGVLLVWLYPLPGLLALTFSLLIGHSFFLGFSRLCRSFFSRKGSSVCFSPVQPREESLFFFPSCMKAVSPPRASVERSYTPDGPPFRSRPEFFFLPFHG